MQAARVRPLVGAVVALTVHGTLGAILVAAPPPSLTQRPAPQLVELEVVRPPPPPPAPPVEPPPPEPVKPVVRRLPRTPRPPEPAAPPPPPIAPVEPPREVSPAFGVSPDSVISGEAAMAVPIGNTINTPTQAQGPLAAPQATGVVGGNGTDPNAFRPVPENFVAESAVVIHEDKAEYPAEAQRMEIEGFALFRVGIDEHGVVREVKLIKGLGHGLDQTAAQSLWRFRFRPARANDGRPVAVRVTFKYRFDLPH